MGANGVTGRLESPSGERLQVRITRTLDHIRIAAPNGETWDIDPAVFEVAGAAEGRVELRIAGREVRFFPGDPGGVKDLDALLHPRPVADRVDAVVDLTGDRNERPRVVLTRPGPVAAPPPHASDAGRAWYTHPALPVAAIAAVLLVAVALLFWPRGEGDLAGSGGVQPTGASPKATAPPATTPESTTTPATTPPATTPPATTPPATTPPASSGSTTANAPAGAALEVLARRALDQAGFADLNVTVAGGIATVTGQVPVADLNSGFFAYEQAVRGVVASVDGVGGTRVLLQLRGDEVVLRNELRELTDAAPVVFESGSAELGPTALGTLDRAASVILSHPGLRILVAGHADPTGSTAFNEGLSNRRAQAVVGYLIAQGVPANRLTAVAYGELFPSDPDLASDRRVDFEVAA